MNVDVDQSTYDSTARRCDEATAITFESLPTEVYVVRSKSWKISNAS